MPPVSSHFLNKCSFLAEQDRKCIANTRQIADILYPPEPETGPIAAEPDGGFEDTMPSASPKAFRIQTRQSL